MISLKQLRYALAVEQTLHFKKAAELCNVSPSALSTALNELEKQLGLHIFERDNKKVLVTPIGQEVLTKAREIKLQVDELQHLTAEYQAPLSFPVSLGVIPTIAPYLLPKLLPNLQRKYPNAQLNIIEAQSHELVEKVRLGEIDTAILALPFPLEGLLSFEFWQEDFYWAALKSDVTEERNEITSDELIEQDLILLSEGHCLKDHILDVCKLPPAENSHAVSATSLTTLIQMVLGNLGTTLVPEMALGQLIAQNKELSAVHLNEPSPHRRIAFILRPNYTRMSSIEALKDLCTTALSSNIE
ncbi:LysR family transcriptional regulator [Aliikangiella marina]|uniref:LysR family transcriptional regulator n=1 Tax=Aliikangiella marina TaxID=1712262 RepID=A0A545T7C9_9GAMM|nr:hydrogen peroxide-inducible genes activator [Aliikangiella marina]TQV73126.1 LysR family transcriptional regulator [Aliikangiella marina]